MITARNGFERFTDGQVVPVFQFPENAAPGEARLAGKAGGFLWLNDKCPESYDRQIVQHCIL
jgi:hypothetical protein